MIYRQFTAFVLACFTCSSHSQRYTLKSEATNSLATVLLAADPTARFYQVRTRARPICKTIAHKKLSDKMPCVRDCACFAGPFTHALLPAVSARRMSIPVAISTSTALRVGFVSSAASWTAIASFALATYKPHRILHNSVGVAQALTALPLLFACMSVLAAAAEGDQADLNSAWCRRLLLGVATASIWTTIAVLWSPAFTSATVRTSDPVIYPKLLRVVASIVHVGMASTCIRAWRRAGGIASSLIGGVCDSLWRFAPAEASGRRAEYAVAAASFAIFTAMAILAPFPLATIPSLLGKRLARAFGAWTLLVAVMLFVLKEGDLPKSVASMLNRGLRRTSFAHLGLLLARILFEPASVYPAAMACLPAVTASTLVYALILWVTMPLA